MLVRCGGGFIVFVALLDHEDRTIERAKMKMIVESGGPIGFKGILGPHWDVPQDLANHVWGRSAEKHGLAL